MVGSGLLSLVKKIKSRVKWKLIGFRTRIKHRLFPQIRRRHKLESLVGPIGFWEELRRYQFEFLRNAGLQPHHSLLDVGCGPLQGGVPLIEYLDGQRYVGIDAREAPLNVAHELIAEHRLAGKNPQLLLSQSFGAHELLGHTSFDFIWTSQLLYHLDDSALADLFSQVATLSHRETVFYGDIFVQHPAHAWWYTEGKTWSGFHYHFHTVQSLSSLAAPHGLHVEDIGPLEDHGYPQEVSLCTNRMLRITKARHVH